MAHVPGRFWLCGTGESAILACFVTEVSWEGNTQEVEWHRKIKSAKLSEAVWGWLNNSKILEVPNTKSCSPTWSIFWIQGMCGKPEFLKKHTRICCLAIFETKSCLKKGACLTQKISAWTLCQNLEAVGGSKWEKKAQRGKNIRLHLDQSFKTGRQRLIGS